MPDNVSICGECGFAWHYCDCQLRDEIAPAHRSPAMIDGPVAVQQCELADELRRLHNAARGCEFDLVPADGPIARLALFMHENGARIADRLSTLPTGDKLTAGLERAAQWHDHRARSTPDAFEQELHEVSARHIRQLTAEPDAGAALDEALRRPQAGEGMVEKFRKLVEWAADDFELFAAIPLTEQDQRHLLASAAKFREALSLPTEERPSDERAAAKYPDDRGLKEQVKEVEDTFSGFQMLRDRFADHLPPVPPVEDDVK